MGTIIFNVLALCGSLLLPLRAFGFLLRQLDARDAAAGRVLLNKVLSESNLGFHLDLHL